MVNSEEAGNAKACLNEEMIIDRAWKSHEAAMPPGRRTVTFVAARARPSRHLPCGSITRDQLIGVIE